MEIVTPADAEAHVAALAAELTAPAGDECVLCYTERMLTAFGCDRTLRWVLRWRDLHRPRATRLERRLKARGGFCDCEVLFNGWTSLRGSPCLPRGGQPQWPGCVGSKPHSSRPCGYWRPRRRPRWRPCRRMGP